METSSKTNISAVDPGRTAFLKTFSLDVKPFQSTSNIKDSNAQSSTKPHPSIRILKKPNATSKQSLDGKQNTSSHKSSSESESNDDSSESASESKDSSSASSSDNSDIEIDKDNLDALVNRYNNIRSIVRSIKTNDKSETQTTEPEPSQSKQNISIRLKTKPKHTVETKTDVKDKGKSSKVYTSSNADSQSDKTAIEVQSDEINLDMPNRRLESSYIMKKPDIFVKTSPVYLDNRKIFINFINERFLKMKEFALSEKTNLAQSCDNEDKSENNGGFKLLIHQEIVKHYINAITPYRGVLLYHGLGSGKTCSSITIAEGLKHTKQIIVLTPASLRENYIKEIKKCGDQMYRQLQHWEFISTEDHPNLIQPLSQFLGGLPEEYIKKQGGVWLFDIRKSSNYQHLSDKNQMLVDNQLLAMINIKYTFYHYNGITRDFVYEKLSQNNTINPFDNKVVIVDEVHNFVSNIANKLHIKDYTTEKANLLYYFIKTAVNARVIMLSGTPIINYPNEIGILFNMIRGNIVTWRFLISNAPVVARRNNVIINTDYFKTIFHENEIMDLVEYNDINSSLTITRNPYGFVTRKTAGEHGVILDDNGQINDDDFHDMIVSVLRRHGMLLVDQSRDKIRNSTYICLPDKLDEFQDMFFDTQTERLINKNMLSRRILGLSSYLGDLKELLPRFNKEESQYYEIMYIPMSEYQIIEYNIVRYEELKNEIENKKNKKAVISHNDDMNSLHKNVSSTYRIRSRSWCNFVFPMFNGTLGRPKMSDYLDTKVNPAITITDDSSIELEAEVNDGNDDINANEILKPIKASTSKVTSTTKTPETQSSNLQNTTKDKYKESKNKYKHAVAHALNRLRENSEKYFTLETLRELYSPKYAQILTNLINGDNFGIHLLYSSFLTLEGLGIFRIALDFHGYVPFKLKRNTTGELVLQRPNDMSEDEFYNRPWYVLYTGAESAEEKEIARYACNSEWNLISHKYVVNSLKEKCRRLGKDNNNFFGDVIKLIMITKAGAEGINLHNVRYVHIMEPYWHGVRIDQVIGRARRICSHKDLPEEHRQIKVIMYLMTIPDTKTEMLNPKIRMHDVYNHDGNKRVLTTDESLHNIMKRKNNINRQLLELIKETAFDCNIHGTEEGIVCYNHAQQQKQDGTIVDHHPDDRAYHYDYHMEKNDDYHNLNLTKTKIKLGRIKVPNPNDPTLPPTIYVYDKDKNTLYDYDNYKKHKTFIKKGKYNPDKKQIELD